MSVAKKYAKAGVDFLDLVQEGNLGMIIAARKYDPKRPTKFATMATWWIKKYIREVVMKKYMVHIPFNVQIDETKEIRKGAKLHAEHGEELTLDYRTNFEFLREIDDAGYRQDYDGRMENEKRVERLRDVFEIGLSCTEQAVLSMYFDEKGPKEIRDELVKMRLGARKIAKMKRSQIEKAKISKQRVSQIYNKAKSKMAKGITKERKPYTTPAFTEPQVYSYLRQFYPHLREQATI
jgi:RNA polymerase sigma factor (sigma-70 family)